MTKIFNFLLLLLSVTVFINKSRCYDEKQLVPNPYLDVLFELDWSAIYGKWMFKEVFDSMIVWMKSYQDRNGSSYSQFAVILCCDDLKVKCGVRHYFDQKNYIDAMSAIFATKETGFMDFWGLCTQLLAVPHVFAIDRGWRQNATGILIYISGCEFHMYWGGAQEEYKNATIAFRDKVKGQLIFICAKNRGTNGYALNDMTDHGVYGNGKIWKENILTMLRLNNQSEQSIIYHVPNMSIVPAMDNIIPKVEIGIFNCKWKSTCSECLTEKNSSNCFKYCNNTIYQLNGPRGYGIQCPLLTETVPCNCSDYGSSSTFRVVESKGTLEIVLGVLGTLFLIAIFLVFLLCFIRKRRQRKQRESRATQEGKQKDLGVEIQMLPVGTSQGAKTMSKSMPIDASKGAKTMSKSMPIDASKGAKTMSKSMPIDASKGAKTISKSMPIDTSKGTKTMSKSVPIGVSKGAKAASTSVNIGKLDKSPVKKNAKSKSKIVAAEVHGKSPVKNPPVYKGSKK